MKNICVNLNEQENLLLNEILKSSGDRATVSSVIRNLIIEENKRTKKNDSFVDTGQQC